jgi:hypothetical protein
MEASIFTLDYVSCSPYGKESCSVSGPTHEFA